MRLEDRTQSEQRVLVLAARPPDARALCETITAGGWIPAPYDSMTELCAQMKLGAAATVLCEEALDAGTRPTLAATVETEPDWSDPPLIVIATRGAERAREWQLLQNAKGSSHTLLLDRPVRVPMLLMTVQAAVRCRERQYQVRDELHRRGAMERHLRLLMAELNHRVRNTLAIVESLARQTARHAGDVEQFRAVFGQRLRALATVHGLLTRTEFTGATIGDIVASELEPRFATPGHLKLDGPAVMLSPDAAVGLHMAVHELATNAAKYGAASAVNGHVDVTWRIVADERPPQLEFHWVESGGPRVSKPTRTGFGSRLIDRLVAYEFGGRVETQYHPDGLRCDIRFPLTRAVAGEQQLTSPISGAVPQAANDVRR